MYELSLFSGAGLGCCGTRWLLDWRQVGYAECKAYLREVLRRRIADGLLDDAPIFERVEDICGSVAQRYAEVARRADLCITGGFPCQPFSVAGKRRGAADGRNGWPELSRVIREVRPGFAFLENVPGLMGHPYFATILGDLAEVGYDCRWGVISAADVGANHLRKRLWIMADSQSIRCTERQAKRHAGTLVGTARTKEGRKPQPGRSTFPAVNGGQDVADAECSRNERRAGEPGCTAGTGAPRQIAGHGTKVPDAERERLEVEQRQSRNDGAELATVERDGDGWGWWKVEPDVGRVVDGCPRRVDRLAALGDGQVPAVVARAWRELGGA